MSGVRTLALRATAKVNLVLDLVGPRPDGFTEIATIFQEVDLADDVEIAVDPAGQGVALETVGESPCPPVENLAHRAAVAFAGRFGTPGGVSIRLTKRIPSGAGLGGGSADAAAVLAGLARLTGVAVDDPELARIGATLGSDVPYFLVGGLALGRGRGEELEPLPDLPVWPIVLAREGRPLATATVYREARAALTQRGVAPNIRRFLRHLREAPGQLPPLWNDLLPAASHLEPGIVRLIEVLSAAGGRASMTGSGSTVFALFEDHARAEAAAAAIEGRPGVDFVRCTRTLGRGRGPG